MPAPLSSPVDPAIGHLIELAADAAREPPACWGSWPGWLTCGVAAACATGWR